MQNRSRAIGPLSLLLAAPLLMGAAQSGANVTIEVTDMRNAEGTVRACMTTDPDVFPRCREDPDSYRMVVKAKDASRLDFGHVRPGRYAIALLHDENDNGKADRVLGMMPREGFGFSRDAKVSMGPPSFGDAAFEVNGANVRQRIKMRYML